MSSFLMHRVKVTTAAAAVLSALALGACGDLDKTADEYMQSAQEMRLAGNPQGAVLNLKNALQKQPNNEAARFMLGQIYLDIGDGASAEKELQRAQDAGMAAENVRLPLARALLLQREYDTVLKELPAPSPTQADYAKVLTLRGQAYIGQGELDEAEAAFRAARDADAEAVDALIGLARVALNRDDMETARELQAEVEALDADGLESLSLKGDIAYLEGDYATAETAYKTMLRERPQSMTYRMALAWAQLRGGNLDGAETGLKDILKALPNNTRANYLFGLVKYEQDEFREARALMDKVLSEADRSAPALLVAGASSYSLEEYEQALGYLNRFVSVAPKFEPGLKLLALTQMRAGQPDKARATLEPIATSAELQDGEILQIVGMAAAASGDEQSGKNYIERAVQRQPQDSNLRAELGRMRINLGETDQGLSDLESAAEDNPDLNVDLAVGYFRAGEYERALTAARGIQKSAPESSLGYVIEGMAQDRLGNENDARAAYEKALELNPSARDAAHNLATLELRNERPEEARRIYTDFLKDNPDDVAILTELARVDAQLGNLEELEKSLRRATDAAPDAIAPRIMLGRYYLSQGEYAEGERVIQEVLQDAPNNPAVLEILGLAQLNLGRSESVATIRRLVEVNPTADAYYWLARAYRQNGDLPAARRAIDRARSMAPANTEMALYQGQLAWEQRDAKALRAALDAAEAEADTVQYKQLAGYQALLDGRNKEAENILTAVAAEAPESDIIIQLAVAQARQGAMDDAATTMAEWLDANPEDAMVRLQLGELYLGTEQFDAAVDQFESLVEYYPDAWAGHNNLAWALLQKGDLDAALSHAERANDLAPSEPSVNDTYGTALLEDGNYRKAIIYLEQAARALPEHAATRIALAKAYAGADRRQEAVRTLEELIARNGDFPQRAEAESLLASYETGE